MEKEKRIVGGYEIINAVHIGDRELLLGINMHDRKGNYYMTCYAENNSLVEYYSEAFASDDYFEIAGIYAERLKEQILNTKTAQDKICDGRSLLTPEMCNTDIFDESFIGKVLVLKPDALRPEYRSDINQLIFCKNGNGANPSGHGSSIYGDYLSTGEKMHFHRCDILGELKSEYYPEWAINRIEVVKEFYNNEKSFEYGGKTFIPVGMLPLKKERDVSKGLSHNKELVFKNRSGEGLRYTYRDFMDAARDTVCDVFKCYENGKYYVPKKNLLYEYSGKYKSIDEMLKHKKKISREVER